MASTKFQDAAPKPDFDEATLIRSLATLARDLTRAGTSAEEGRGRLLDGPLLSRSGKIRGLERARWVVPLGSASGATLELTDEHGRALARLHAPRAKRHAWTYLVNASLLTDRARKDDAPG